LQWRIRSLSSWSASRGEGRLTAVLTRFHHTLACHRCSSLVLPGVVIQLDGRGAQRLAMTDKKQFVTGSRLERDTCGLVKGTTFGALLTPALSTATCVLVLSEILCSLRPSHLSHDRTGDIQSHRKHQEARRPLVEVSLTSIKRPARSRPWRPKWARPRFGTTASARRSTSAN
jgi:hypothetical protein